jgi:glycosyltransferase involved in cell wall biosynthesis
MRGGDKISVVVAVHNEEKYLPYCIAGLVQSQIYEVVFVLDRCTDRSAKIIESARFPFKVRVIEMKEKRWKSPTAEPAAIGCRAAEGDFVYVVNCDMYVDPRMFMVDWTGMDFCSFVLKSYPLWGNVRSMFMAKLRERLILNYERMRSRTLHKRYGTGAYAFRKSIYQFCPHIDCDAEDCYFLSTCMYKGYRYRYFWRVGVLHLRPDNPRSLRFRARLAVCKYHVSLPKAVYYALKYLSPTYLEEYLATRASKLSQRTL